MKYYRLLIIIFLLNSGITEAQNFENDSILIWNENRKLTWDDFKTKKTIQNSIGWAATGYNIKFRPKNLSDNELNKIKIIGIFSKKRSWVVLESDQVLNHEQTHFNITELYARKIRDEIESYITQNKDLQLDFIASIYYKAKDKLEIKQAQYDKETNHSKNTVEQKKWDRKIDSLLQVYKDYERNYTIEDLEEEE